MCPRCVYASSRTDGPSLTPSTSELFSTPQRAWHKDHIVGVTWLKLEATELDPGSTYEARLRVQMATLEDAVAEEERYEGPWSDWSQPACFHSPQRQGGCCRLQGPGWGLPAPWHPTPSPSWDPLPRGPVDCLPLEV